MNNQIQKCGATMKVHVINYFIISTNKGFFLGRIASNPFAATGDLSKFIILERIFIRVSR